MFQGVQERAYTLTQVAGVQARTGDREAARRTFQRAEQLAETVSLDDSVYSPHILLWIVRAEEQHGFRDEAIAAARELLRIAEAPIRDEFKKQGIYTNLIKTQAGLGDRAGVQQTLEAGRAFGRKRRARKKPLLRNLSFDTHGSELARPPTRGREFAFYSYRAT